MVEGSDRQDLTERVPINKKRRGIMSFNVRGIAGFISGHNGLDQNGNPAGGEVKGKGFQIEWQNGPLGRGEDRQEANGAFVEDVMTALLKRLEFYQRGDDYLTGPPGKFSCRENALAITHLEESLHWLQARTARRELEGVEGTHEGR